MTFEHLSVIRLCLIGDNIGGRNYRCLLLRRLNTSQNIIITSTNHRFLDKHLSCLSNNFQVAIIHDVRFVAALFQRLIKRPAEVRI